MIGRQVPAPWAPTPGSTAGEGQFQADFSAVRKQHAGDWLGARGALWMVGWAESHPRVTSAQALRTGPNVEMGSLLMYSVQRRSGWSRVS